jgi:large subunit ribosomal protein L30
LSNVKIRQTRSANGIKPNQRATLRALGLGRPGTAVERPDSPQLRGQLRVVEHLVKVNDGGK